MRLPTTSSHKVIVSAAGGGWVHKVHKTICYLTCYNRGKFMVNESVLLVL